ncbi:MAG: hypothetical protein M1275_00440 [Patescibacteria group bacterium]|nr:hypothetical protein [Patescibacteria group bacterium]
MGQSSEFKGWHDDFVLETREKIDSAEPLSGREVAKIIENLYGRLPPDIGCHLAESNVVLTLSGMKGMTQFYVEASAPSDAERIKSSISQLNDWLIQHQPELQFVPARSPRANVEGRQLLSVGVNNLRGYERASRLSKLPGVRPFDSQEGFTGLGQWMADCGEGLRKAQVSGALPKDYSIGDIEAGLYFGYPDQAILDRVDQVAKRGGGMEGLQDSVIPFTGVHRETDPNFEFYPEHAKAPEVKDYELKAGTVLRDFYFSPSYKKLSADSHFRELRAKEDYDKTRG